MSGYIDNASNVNVFWIKPDNSIACQNTSGGDRPEASAAAGVVDVISYPGSSYDVVCPAIGAGDAGIWNVRLETSQLKETVTLAAFVVVANNAPAGTDKTVTTLEDTAYIFVAADFGFTDVDAGDTLSAVRIDTLSLAAGSTLQKSGVGVSAGQEILTADIGSLVFTPRSMPTAPATRASPSRSATPAARRTTRAPTR